MLTSRSTPSIRNGVAIALVLLAAFAPAQAQARIKGPVGDTFSMQCLALQNKGDKLIAELATATPARRDEIILELRANGLTWIQIGCRAVFGSISSVVRRDTQTAGTGGGAMSLGSTGESTVVDPVGETTAPAPSFL